MRTDERYVLYNAAVVAVEVPILLVPVQRTSRSRWSSNGWLVAACVLLACAVFVGWLSAAYSLVSALIIFVFAVLALIRGIKLRSSAQLEAMRRMQGCCIRCGYSLKGNVSGVCPECGEAIESNKTG